MKKFISDNYIKIEFAINGDKATVNVTSPTNNNELMKLYNTNIEDNERKLEYIVNMIFPNGTMFDTYNTAENVKKEFNMYIKNYIS